MRTCSNSGDKSRNLSSLLPLLSQCGIWRQGPKSSPKSSSVAFCVVCGAVFTILLYFYSSRITSRGADGVQHNCRGQHSVNFPLTAADASVRHSSLWGCPSDIRVFVGVLSRSSSFQARQAIRATWGSDQRLERVMFFVMRPRSQEAFQALREEAAEHGDLVVSSEVYESYFNGTYSVINLMRAAAGLADRITHVMKTDEDCYVRVDLLLQTLRQMPKQWLYAGRVTTIKVNRDPKYRWAVPVTNWASNDSITYTWGMATVLSVDLVRHLAAGAVHVSMPPQNLLWVEDLAVGVWVAQVAKEQHVVVNYNDTLTCSAERCRDTDIVTANLQPPLHDAFHCIHSSNGQCCGEVTVVKESPTQALQQ